MCVEAAVCFALGMPHGDKPACVGDAVRAYKINLNDSPWSSDQARAKGMRRIAIAQLGSDKIDQRAFAEYVVVECVKRILPTALCAVAARNPKHAGSIIATIPACQATIDLQSAEVAANAAYAVTNVASVASAVIACVSATANANATANAALAASQAAHAATDASSSDEILSLAAEIGVEALQKLNCEGCQWLWMTQKEKS